MQAATPVIPSKGASTPLSIHDVTIRSGFWADRQRLNRSAIIPHIIAWERRMGWVDNFRKTADGTVSTTRRGAVFTDSDVYKMLEDMAWEIGRAPDPALQREFDLIVGDVARAQRPDGYLETAFGNGGAQPDRYSDLEWGHELYCFGHLLQAAVARIRTGHPDCVLVKVARRVADRVVEDFRPGGIERVGGHPEIETALVEFGRATGDRRYVEAASLFIDRRGHHTLADSDLGREYYQDDVPIRDARRLRGHAVRALYLTAGAVDCAVENDDHALFDAVRRQYRDALAKRTYITGGMGSRHRDEAFGDDFELPPDRAYCETCAGVASIMVAWRLLLATGDLSYGDVIERTLYNVIATSPSAEGTSFFYVNPLQQRVPARPADPDTCSPRAQAQLRAPWFEVSCCPTNVARTISQLGAYVAVVGESSVRLVQFMPCDIDAALGDGRRVALRVRTAYPDDGRIEIEVVDAPEGEWAFEARIPRWAGHADVTVRPGDGGAPTRLAFDRTDRVSVAGRMGAGTRIVMELPVVPRFTFPDDRIDAVRGDVAVECGPLVYCMESIDQEDGRDVADFRIDASSPLRKDGDVVIAKGEVLDFDDAGDDGGDGDVDADGDADGCGPLPYSGRQRSIRAKEAVLRLVPYHTWGNRGPSTMRVWIPVR